MAQTRAAIADGTFDAFRRDFLTSPAAEANRELDD
jgi:queuine/archaeosine tRNA-ribosyltransferase